MAAGVWQTVAMLLAPQSVSARRTLRARGPVAALAALWILTTVAYISAPFLQGLRGQYVEGLDSSGPAAHTARDREMSTTWILFRWWFMAPQTFNVRWTGYLIIDRPGLYTFQIISDDESQFRIGQQPVIDAPEGSHVAAGTIQLDRGAHRVLLESYQRGGPYSFEWSWARDGEPLTPVPPSALSITRREPWVVDLMRALPWLWRVVTMSGAIAALWMAYQSNWLRRSAPGQRVRIAIALVFFSALAAFYVIAATEHARRVNTSKARADQSGYLRDAQEVYANWHGQEPWRMVGMRNRMPLYAAYQALFWDPHQSNDEFFERAKIWNIRLSLALLIVLGSAFFLLLPPLLATNLTLVVAFGVFIFKAGYTQSELLFYSLFFFTFLACCQLFRRTVAPPRLVLRGVAAGALAGLAHLTKAAALPLVVIFAVVYGGREIAFFIGRRSPNGAAAGGAARAHARWRLAAGMAMLLAFVATVYPYIATNKRVFGQYFYNVNTTFYVWYDDWASASVGTRGHGDESGWPNLPASEIPSMSKYLETHTVPDILGRFAGGAQDMVVRSYDTFWYAKYVLLYLVLAVALIAANARAAAAMIAANRALFTFLVLYAGVYLAATAFYAPISGTGTTRFLLAHVMPLLFTLSYFFASPPFRETRWSMAGVTITPTHVHLLVLVTIGLDLTFTLWPRLMSTYGGF
jgi:hypothetical protein